MPRAHRHFLAGQFWHITHRCHEQSFLLKLAFDRRTYLGWLFEAKKRFGLRILNYTVTSNHIHLLLQDSGEDVIARSLQLVAGRTAQEYNLRKKRRGAFWEDRYHATAIEGGGHLLRCLVYIDLNMARAGVVRHPSAWVHGGYREIQRPPKRYSLIDLALVSASCGFNRVEEFQRAHRQWVEDALVRNALQRERGWSEAVAAGSPAFVERIKTGLGDRARYRTPENDHGLTVLREPWAAYRGISGLENRAPRPKMTLQSE